MSLNKRNIWLDVAKGFVIILMVIGHSSIPKLLSDFIWSFHMPFFFIASGFVMNFDKYTSKSYFHHSVQTLLVPFISYSLIVLICYYFLDKNPVDVIINGWQGYALWFIPVLFISRLLAHAIYLYRFKFNLVLSLLILLFMGGGGYAI